MNEELEFLSEESSTSGLEESSAHSQSLGDNAFVAPSWEDVKAGKISYKDLPSNMKAKVKQEAYEATPEDKKYLWDEYNYVPPELYNGVDRNGRQVQAYDTDGFEELIRRGKITKKSKVEQDVENLTTLVKEQNKTILSQQERDIDKRLEEAKEAVDFETYEKLLIEKQGLKFQKLQLDKTAPKTEPKQSSADYSQAQLPTLEEQATIEIFAQNNKAFVDVMQLSPEMTKYFDDQSALLRARNPNASIEQILAATKTITENRFNLNKQQKPTMSRNIIQSEQKTNLNSQPTQKLSYSTLSDRDKKWVNSEARSGKPKYSGKSLDEITNMVYGHLLKK